MVSANTKTERLIALEYLLLSHSGGLSRSEIARRLGVHKSTVGRYITELSIQLPLFENEDGRVCIDPDRYLNNIRLTLHEIMALYLATTLMIETMDRRNAHAASALRKIGKALHPFAPKIAEMITREGDVMDGPYLVADNRFLSILECLTKAWSLGRKVGLSHFSKRRNEESTYLFSPFAILPYAAGRSLHAVGLCDGEQTPRVLRVDRITSAELLSDTYTVPSDFDPTSYFKDAWGIWRSEDGPERVVLRFSKEVARRLQETQWHRNQTISMLPGGGACWEAWIEEPREMVPWIRGWGSDVEVLQPVWLRTELAREAEKLVKMYRK